MSSILQSGVQSLLSGFKPQEQALILNHYGIAIPGYPTMYDVGIIDADGWFLVAGERVKRLERKSVDKIERLAAALKANESDFVVDQEGAHAGLLKAILERQGTYIANPNSRPSSA